MNKFIILCTVILSMVTQNVEAGIISKSTKAYVAGKLVQKATPIITKKIADKVAKKAANKALAKEALRKNELKVDKYEDLIAGRPKAKQLGDQTEQLDGHHMPSARYIESKGIPKGEGIAMETQPARHMQTRTYGNKDPNLLNESPREALGRDVRDMKQVYENNSLYNSEVREALQKVIQENKNQFPNMYKK